MVVQRWCKVIAKIVSEKKLYNSWFSFFVTDSLSDRVNPRDAYASDNNNTTTGWIFSPCLLLPLTYLLHGPAPCLIVWIKIVKTQIFLLLSYLSLFTLKTSTPSNICQTTHLILPGESQTIISIKPPPPLLITSLMPQHQQTLRLQKLCLQKCILLKNLSIPTNFQEVPSENG